MPTDSSQLDHLKTILENLLTPQRLDTHPWVRSLVVQQAVAETPGLQERSPGQQLAHALGKLFAGSMPAAAPRQGKRLDTRWGEFGLLAAQYFAPLLFGVPAPDSLRDAWGRIDQSILLFVYGRSEVAPAEKETYKLVGDELEVAPNSTLSDWNRKGLQRLLEVILARESYLSASLSLPPVISRDGRGAQDSSSFSGQGNSKLRRSKTRPSKRRRFVFLLLGFLFFGCLLIGGFKAWRVYNLALLLRQDAAQLQELIAAPTPYLERARAVGPALSTLDQDFETLKNEVEPFLWLGPWLNWVPVYGGELASVQDLVSMADSLLAAADLSYQAVMPLLAENGSSALDPTRLTEILRLAQPRLLAAQEELDRAIAARSRLLPDRLSPEVRDLLLNDVDRLLVWMQDGLTVAVEFPVLMGAASEGPKTYLLLVQNEDELRPTGGFITAVGTLLVQDGQISSLAFMDSGLLEDWSKPYPAAPWQLREYMNSRVLILRDTNWFTDYPVAALYAESLYSYVSDHSVDGVIAFDQQMLVEILGLTGPIELADVPYPIDATNVIAYMRSEKTRSEEEYSSLDWSSKAFLPKIANALVEKIFSGDIPPESLFALLLQVLQERHLLLQLDSPAMTSLLARYRWDGAVRPAAGGDFLMVVDSNIGFNKTNAVVASSLSYEVDLTTPLSPIASLTVLHTNNAAPVLCTQWNKIRLPEEKGYPITDCYWNYLRVYRAAGTSLLDAVPQFVPANWMILKQDVPARVDLLDEGIAGVQAFGTLQVVPGGASLAASFRFALPADIVAVQPGTNQLTYHLRVQKQPGTLAVPLTLHVYLPQGASVLTLPPGAIIQGQDVLLQTDLRTDLDFELVFTVP